MRNGSPHVAGGVAILKPADEDRIEHRPGDDTELARSTHRVGESPVGNRNAHSTLNNSGQRRGVWLRVRRTHCFGSVMNWNHEYNACNALTLKIAPRHAEYVGVSLTIVTPNPDSRSSVRQ